MITPLSWMSVLLVSIVVATDGQELTCAAPSARDLVVKLNDLSKNTKEKGNELNDRLNKLRFETDKRLRDLNATFHDLEEQSSEDIKHIEASIIELQNDLDEQDSHFNTSIEDLRQRLGVIGADIEGTKTTTDSLNATIQGVKERIKVIRAEIQKLKGTAQCPDGWVFYNRSCYLFSDTQQIFKDAANQCDVQSAHLVYVENSAENQFLGNFLDTLKDPTENFWIGINKETGSWLFYGISTNVTFFDFAVGEPTAGENCASIAKQTSFHWFGYPCGSLFKYICEKPFYYSKDSSPK